MKKNAKNGAQKEEISIGQELSKEINAYNRAHSQLVNKLIAYSGEPMFILSALHAVHSISMKQEQDLLTEFIRTRKASDGKK